LAEMSQAASAASLKRHTTKTGNGVSCLVARL
jgi:hypothetical protein